MRRTEEHKYRTHMQAPLQFNYAKPITKTHVIAGISHHQVNTAKTHERRSGRITHQQNRLVIHLLSERLRRAQNLPCQLWQRV